jgi:hypothetical protein
VSSPPPTEFAFYALQDLAWLGAALATVVVLARAVAALRRPGG